MHWLLRSFLLSAIPAAVVSSVSISPAPLAPPSATLSLPPSPTTPTSSKDEALDARGAQFPSITFTARDAQQPPVSLNATITQVNRTHINVVLANENTHDVVLLTWQSLLEEAAEYHSFSIQPASGGDKLSPGVDAVRFIYDEDSLEDSLMTLAAGTNWSTTFDVTRAFNIPQAGSYQVSFQSSFPGAKASDNATLEAVSIASEPATFDFEASAPVLHTRQSDIFAGCPNDKQTVLQAINIAGWMAYDAIYNSNYTLINEYFGVSPSTPDTLASVGRILLDGFYNINHYDVTTDTSITWNCDATNTVLPSCKGTVRGYYSHFYNSINFCKGYFAGAAVSACVEPGPARISVYDQASTVFHELSHDNTLMPQDVDDFPDPFNAPRNCYNYICATAFAQSRNPLPERSAINLQQYAQAIRHRVHPDWGCLAQFASPPGPPPAPPGSAQEADDAADGECIDCSP